jgi:hypothetical protein
VVRQTFWTRSIRFLVILSGDVAGMSQLASIVCAHGRAAQFASSAPWKHRKISKAQKEY